MQQPGRAAEIKAIGIGKSFGSFLDFDLGDSPVGLGLYKRAALAKSASVSPDGDGSHRIRINGDVGAATDPDGFVWE